MTPTPNALIRLHTTAERIRAEVQKEGITRVQELTKDEVARMLKRGKEKKRKEANA